MTEALIQEPDVKIGEVKIGELRMSPRFEKIAAALAKAQAKISPAPADAMGKVRGDRANYDFYYADLASVREACREALAENEIAVIQSPHVGGKNMLDVTVTTLLAHSSGQWFANDLTLVAVSLNPQHHGTAMTYARRYSLSALVGIASEKDYDENDKTHSKGETPATQKLSGDTRPEPPPVGGEKAPAGGGAAAATGEKTSIRAVPSEAARKVIDSIGSANTQNELAAVFAAVVALPKGEQAEPRMAFVRQLGAYLEQDGHQPTDELGKLLTKSVTGLTDDQKAAARALHSRFFKTASGSAS